MLIFILATLLALNSSKICYGSVLESEFLPFRVSDGNSRFRFGDDTAHHVPFTSPFKFLNKTYWSTYISGNGLLSFGAGNSISLIVWLSKLLKRYNFAVRISDSEIFIFIIIKI